MGSIFFFSPPATGHYDPADRRSAVLPRHPRTSVSPDYKTYERDAEEVHVIGRVVSSARRY
jgi:hypothetical protein